MIKKYYYAVDKDGQGWYYDNPPIWDGEAWNVDENIKWDIEGKANTLHDPKNFSFSIPEGFDHTSGYLEFEIEIGHYANTWT